MPKKDNKKTWHLAVFLLKKEVKSFSSALRKDTTAKRYSLRKNAGFEGEIVIGPNPEKEPRWMSLLRQGSTTTLQKLTNTSCRALLFVRSASRLFAVSFGYGRYMLRESSFYRDFGFRTAVNAVHPDKLRSIDASELEELTVHKTTQASRISPLGAFGVDVLNDLMRAVTGESRDSRIGKTISGRDCAVINVKAEFREIAEKMAVLLEHYESKEYMKRFDWIDNLAEERDPATLVALNMRLVGDLKSRQTNKMHIAPPEIIDWADVEGMAFSQDEDHLTQEIDPVQLIESFRDLDEIGIEQVKHKHLFVKHSSSGELLPLWSAYRCLVYETQLNGDTFVLALGDWYRIERQFATSVKEFVRKIPDCQINFPLHKKDTSEDRYNEDFAKKVKGTVLCHGKLIYCEAARTSIEVCDLFHRDGKLIHVKKKDSSSTLSHLFAQARISATSLLRDAELRKGFRTILETAGINADVTIPEASIDPSELEIVFAVIDASAKPIEESLPFFSLLNFRQATEFLMPYGFRVSKAKIKSK